MPELSTYIVLGTSNLTPDVSDMLEEMGEDVDHSRHFGDWRDNVVRCGRGTGHWVKVIQTIDEDVSFETMIVDLPTCLQDCMRHARHHGARWMQFDRDADSNEIPVYPW